MPYYYFDFTYIIFIIPALLFGFWAQFRVKSTYLRYSKVGTMRGYTGAETARYILEQNGIYDVTIRHITGNLTDNYNPKNKTLNLSDGVYGSSSVAAVGIAAHETGHAIQHAIGYFPIKLREAVIPVTQIGSWLYMPLLLVGMLFSSQSLIDIGILMFSMIAVFQFLTLPVEFNASNRAIQTIREGNILYGDEVSGARSVLKAAALTYVAALVSSLAQILRLLVLFGGSRRRD